MRLRRGRPAEPEPRTRPASFHAVINVDASFSPNQAGLAYVGTLGEASTVADCATSTEAEFRAMLFAMEAAARHGLRKVMFRTDCDNVATPKSRPRTGETLRQLRRDLVTQLRANRGWKIVHVPRSENSGANILARRALRQAVKEAA